jgi:hypothetical protein
MSTNIHVAAHRTPILVIIKSRRLSAARGPEDDPGLKDRDRTRMSARGVNKKRLSDGDG